MFCRGAFFKGACRGWTIPKKQGKIILTVKELAFIYCGGLALSLVLALAWSYFERRLAMQKAKAEGDDLIGKAQERAEAAVEKSEGAAKSLREGRLRRFEAERDSLKKHVQRLQAETDRKSHQLKMKKRESAKLVRQMRGEIFRLRAERKTMEKAVKDTLSSGRSLQLALSKKIEERFAFDIPRLKAGMKSGMEDGWRRELSARMEKSEDELRANLQKSALFYLMLALSRFERPYCPERSIPPARFRSKRQMERAAGPRALSRIEEECGVDIVARRDELQASVFGIDPVRRELGRLTLKKLCRRRHISPRAVKEAVRGAKKELFAKIKSDGRSICRKLSVKSPASEIQNMMGALRYRYSFAQNQHFHCEEAGWLCGLLSSEMGLSTERGRRAGMLHDIGKAMDHSIEGGHAVIGADFIAKRGEPEDIVHAVRAHHHDEPPSTPLAFLVIAADAISGARPGARRSTEDSYSKKMATLERIIDSFDNIRDAYIMGAGREMRVIVDNEKSSDRDALDLSRRIAGKIEKECSYPGLIKVTVVRRSEAFAMAH